MCEYHTALSSRPIGTISPYDLEALANQRGGIESTTTLPSARAGVEEIRNLLFRLTEEESLLARGTGKNKRLQHRKFMSRSAQELQAQLGIEGVDSTDASRAAIIAKVRKQFEDESLVGQVEQIFRSKQERKNS